MSRRSEKKGIGIIGIIITVIIAAVLIFSVSVIKDAAGIGGGDKVCAVEIPDGAGSSGISKILKESSSPRSYFVTDKVTGYFMI